MANRPIERTLYTAEQKRGLGIYHKFEVRRTDGRDEPGQKHNGCDYFVLDLTHDPFAAPAIAAYAKACAKELPLLADDLRKRLRSAGRALDGKKH